MASDAIDRLITGLGRLPGVGAKSARRIALEILTWDTEDVRALADLMESGWLQENEALQIAADWLFNNPNRFFKLGLDPYRA